MKIIFQKMNMQIQEPGTIWNYLELAHYIIINS